MLSLLAGLALAASDNLPTYEYARTEGGPDAGAVSFARWMPGHVLHAAVPTVLRSAPDAPADGAKVPAGGEVTIVSVGADATAEGMANAWYEVRAGAGTGWVFGAALTPIAVTADLDLDGDPDVATVSFTPDLKIRVRVGDKALDLDTAGGGYLNQKGAAVYLEALVPAEKVGVPLLHLRTGVEACADFAEYWISFRDGPVLAHTDAGLVDPPNCYTFEPTYKPGKLVMTYEQSACGEDNERPRRRRKTLRLVDGVFR